MYAWGNDKFAKKVGVSMPGQQVMIKSWRHQIVQNVGSCSRMELQLADLRLVYAKGAGTVPFSRSGYGT